MTIKRRLDALERAVSAKTAQHDETYDERYKQAFIALLSRLAARYYAAPQPVSECSVMQIASLHCFDPDGSPNPSGSDVLRALLTIDPTDPRQCDQFKRQYAPEDRLYRLSV